MNPHDIKRNLENNRGRLEVVNAGRDYMCYIDDGHTITGNKQICLVGEIKSVSGGVYDISGLWGSDMGCKYVKDELEKRYGNLIEFSSLGSGSYKITKGQYSTKFDDMGAWINILAGSGEYDRSEQAVAQINLEKRVREEEHARHRDILFDGLMKQLTLDFERGDWKQYINLKLRIMRDFKDILRIKNPFMFNYNLGYAYTQVGNPREAIKWYRKALAVKTDVNLFYFIALLYESFDVDKAINWYKTFIKFKKDKKYFKIAFNKVALLYVRKFHHLARRPKKAVRAFDKLAKWLRIKKLSVPIKELKGLLEEDTDDKQKRTALYSLARDYSKRGNFREGRKYYQLLIDGLNLK